MRGIIKFAGIGALAYLGAISTASAVPVAGVVDCGNTTQGTRYVRIDEALVDGYCATTIGNLDSSALYDDLIAAGLVEIDKDVVPGDDSPGDGSEGALQFTRDTKNSGEWSFDEALWDIYESLYIAFHFGGGDNNTPGPTATGNPDSFVIELFARQTSGTYALLGGDSTGLSNIYLFGVRCTDPDGCNPPLDVPEPGTLGLLGLGLAGLGFGFRRRRKI